MNKPIKKNSKPGIPKRDQEIYAQCDKAVRSHIGALSEFLSSVQIVGTVVTASGQTHRVAYGSGDILSRMKAAEIWLDDAEGSLP